MKRSLFGETGRFYKANLHGHTTVSDGRETPEEIKEIYKKAGYQIVAFTDHDVLVEHSDLNDEEFLALTGVEYEFNESEKAMTLPFSFVKTYHMLLFSPVPEVTHYPYGNPDYVWAPNAKAYIQDFYTGDASHEYRIADVNAMIKAAHESGFLVCYNHPAWSLNTYPDYCNMKDVDFVECGNSSCLVEGYVNDMGDHVYQDFLLMGEWAAPLSSDDGHDHTMYGLAHSGIKADALTYEAVFEALKEKRVYASWGPDFEDLQFDPETGTLTVSSSPVREMNLITERRSNFRLTQAGALFTEGTFDLNEYLEDTLRYGNPETSFIRVVIIDADGNRAITRGYKVSELL